MAAARTAAVGGSFITQELAMMRIVILLIFCAFVMPAQAAGFWAGLWRNADQQGEALMQKGDASSAAQAYADPRRKAYAKLKAGDYQGAAEQLDTLHESDDDYNRGNAFGFDLILTLSLHKVVSQPL